jgi:hypothetical protein
MFGDCAKAQHTKFKSVRGCNAHTSHLSVNTIAHDTHYNAQCSRRSTNMARLPPPPPRHHGTRKTACLPQWVLQAMSLHIDAWSQLAIATQELPETIASEIAGGMHNNASSTVLACTTMHHALRRHCCATKRLLCSGLAPSSCDRRCCVLQRTTHRSSIDCHRGQRPVKHRCNPVVVST